MPPTWSLCVCVRKTPSSLSMKKPDAVTVITEDNFRDKVWPLAASEIIYVGRATAKKLEKYGIYTIGGIAATSPCLMKQWFGVNGLALWNFASGLPDYINDNPYVKAYLEKQHQLQARIKELEEAQGERRRKATMLTHYIRSLEEQKTALTAFDERVWAATVQTVTVRRDGELVFRFKDGTEKAVQIDAQ